MRVSETGPVPQVRRTTTMDAPPRRAPPEALRNETARSRAIAHFAAYWLFLLFILAAVFTPRYTRHFYRQTAAVREPLLRNEILDNVFLENAMSAEQVYLALETLLVPHAFQDRYYAGLVPGSVDARGRYGRGQAFSRDDKTLKYRPRYTAMALLALGRVRLRQLRVRADGGAACRAPGFLKAFYATHAGAGAPARCFARYSRADQDAGDLALRDPADGTDLALEYRASSDGGGWVSPYSKVDYGPGGQVKDLRVGARLAREDLRQLRRAGFVDNATRAVFADMSWYNPNVDMFTHARLAFEFLPAGKVRPTVAVDSAPLLHLQRALKGEPPYAPRDRAAVLLEFALYLMSFWYLVRVTEDVTDYASLKAYLAVGWNVADVASVACFVVALVMRVVTSLKMLMGHVNTFSENVAADQHEDLGGAASYDKYIRLRLTFQYYRYGRNFLAAGVLVNFVKAFKFLSVSRQLSQFTRTIYVVSAEMLNVLLILAIVLVGFAIAFHVLLGHAIAKYRTFSDAAITLLLVVFGDFDLEEIIAFAPLLGVLLMLAFVVIMTFIILTMLLKIVDVSYGEVLEEISGGEGDLARDMRLALYRLAYDAYWTVQIRCTLCRARGALARTAGPGGAHAQKPPARVGAGSGAAGPRAPPDGAAAAEEAAAAVAPADGRSDLRRALAKREAHLKKRSRAFDPDAERRLLVDHFIREGRDVFEGDVEGSDVGDRFAKVLGQQAALAELSGKFAEVS